MRHLFYLMLGLASPVLAQTTIQVKAQVGTSTFQILNGGLLTLPSTGVGRDVLANVTVSNPGSTAVVITQLIVGGSSDITSLANLTLPLTVAPNGSFLFTLRYLPSSGLSALSQASIAVTSGSASQLFSFSVTGVTPDPSLSFFLNPDGPLTPLAAGGRLAFPATPLQTQRTATVIVANRGSAPAVLSSATVSGVDFLLTGSPALPATIQPNQDIRFTIRFLPQTRGTSIGSAIFTISERATVITLEGLGSVTDFSASYQLQADGSTRSLSNSGQLVFLPANLNTPAQATVILVNQGGAPGAVNGVSVSGSGFQLAGVPALPSIVDPSRELRFNVLFTPVQPGTFTGTLRIDFADRSLLATLSGSTGTGDLTVAYFLQSDGNTHALSNGSSLLFSPTSLNSPAQATVVIANQTSLAGRVLSVSSTGPAFQLQNVPLLPANVEGGRDFRFNVIFTPRQTGLSTGSLRIDFPDRSISVSLAGSTSNGEFSFAYVLESDNNTRAISNGNVILFQPAAVNVTAQAELVIANNGAGAGVVNSIAISGAAFKLSGLPAFPLSIEPAKTAKVVIQFIPPQIGTFTGSLRVDVDGRQVTFLLEGSAARPEFLISYQDPSSNNNTAVTDRGTVLMPFTQVNQSNTAAISIANNGRGTGFLNRITLTSPSGSVYQLTDLPPFPLAIPADRIARFGVRFSPTAQQRYSGTLQIELTDQTITLFLEGLAQGPSFSYERADTDPPAPVNPGQTIALGEVPMNTSQDATLLIRNTGTSDGQLGAITVTGTGFQLVDAPFTPAPLKVGETQRVLVRFAPAQPGPFTGRLRIGDDSFTLSGVGAGARLTYSFLTGDTPTSLDESGVVVLNPTRVGEQSQVEFAVHNEGNRPIVVSSINFTAPSSVFLLEGLPPLPLNLAADQSFRFLIRFVPNDTATASATLRVNNTPFAVTGTGTNPLPLPEFRFTGTGSGIQEPLQQPSIGLTLASPYPLPLRGALALNFVSDVFSGNSAVQFSSGGRTAGFTIPANTTQAIFDGGATTVRLQTGSTAGSIVVIPAFATTGGLNLTPPAPQRLTYTINRSVPKLLDASIGSRSLAGLTIVFTGYTTSRSLKQMEVQLTARPGQPVGNSKITINLESSSLLWFQSAAADTFGGLFTLSLPLTLQGGNATGDLVGKIQSFSILVYNELGVSNTLTVNVP